MSAFAAIRDGHERLRALFDRFEGLGPRSHREKREILHEVRAEVDLHRALDREVIYPEARKAGIATDAEKGHPIVDRLLAELDELAVEDRWFSAVFAVLRENVEEHIREEQRDVLAELDRRLNPPEREALRRAIEERHESARSAPC